MRETKLQHPIQTHPDRMRGLQGKIPEAVALRAYEVYCKKYGRQPALIDLEGRNCRGGFGLTELIAFLYARSFPESEWSERVDEAWEGMEGL